MTLCKYVTTTRTASCLYQTSDCSAVIALMLRLVQFVFSLYVLLQLDFSGGQTVSLSLTSYNSLKNFGLRLEDCGCGLSLEGCGLSLGL